jgi:hypothetical protein
MSFVMRRFQPPLVRPHGAVDGRSRTAYNADAPAARGVSACAVQLWPWHSATGEHKAANLHEHTAHGMPRRLGTCEAIARCFACQLARQPFEGPSPCGNTLGQTPTGTCLPTRVQCHWPRDDHAVRQLAVTSIVASCRGPLARSRRSAHPATPSPSL